jgi:hypothetical protein
MRGLARIFGLGFLRYGGEWPGRSDRTVPAQEVRQGWFVCQWHSCRGTRYAAAIDHVCWGVNACHPATPMRPLSNEERLENTEGLVIDNEVEGF